MTDYWKSKDNYWCKTCSVWIRNDKPSRSSHENGLKHKGNLERFINSQYKAKEISDRDRAQENKIMQEINFRAALAHNADSPSGSTASISTSSPSAYSQLPPHVPKRVAGDRMSNYSTAESLGFFDPDSAERELRAQEGRIGDWQLTSGGDLYSKPTLPSISDWLPQGPPAHVLGGPDVMSSFDLGNSNSNKPRMLSERQLVGDEIFDPVAILKGHRNGSVPSSSLQMAPPPSFSLPGSALPSNSSSVLLNNHPTIIPTSSSSPTLPGNLNPPPSFMPQTPGSNSAASPPALAYPDTIPSSSSSSSTVIDGSNSNFDYSKYIKYTDMQPDGSKIKRPRNAWIIYRSEKIRELEANQKIKESGSSGTQAQFSKVVADMWKNESEAVKKEYESKAEIEKAEHQKKYPNYKYCPQKRKRNSSGADSKAKKSKSQKDADAPDEDDADAGGEPDYDDASYGEFSPTSFEASYGLSSPDHGASYSDLSQATYSNPPLHHTPSLQDLAFSHTSQQQFDSFIPSIQPHTQIAPTQEPVMAAAEDGEASLFKKRRGNASRRGNVRVSGV